MVGGGEGDGTWEEMIVVVGLAVWELVCVWFRVFQCHIPPLPRPIRRMLSEQRNCGGGNGGTTATSTGARKGDERCAASDSAPKLVMPSRKGDAIEPKEGGLCKAASQQAGAVSVRLLMLIPSVHAEVWETVDRVRRLTTGKEGGRHGKAVNLPGRRL